MRCPARSGGFTLLELLITLGLIGLLVGIVTVALGRFSRAAENRAALIGVVNALTAARVEAMRTSRPVRVTVEIAEGVVRVDEGVADRESRYRTGLVQFRDEQGNAAPSAVAEFDTLGRTRERLWLVEEGSGRSASPAGQVLPGEAVRIWRIEFDPVSGAPVLRTPGDPSARPASGTR